MTSKNGFTEKEEKTHDTLMRFLKEFRELPVQHPSDDSEIANAVHVIQGCMAIRILRRTHPEGWPTYVKTGGTYERN